MFSSAVKNSLALRCSCIFRSLRIGSSYQQGCQMVHFQTKIFNLGKFWRVLQWKMLAYLGRLGLLWYILWPFDILSGNLVYFPRFSMLYQEKSGNPGYQLWSRSTACEAYSLSRCFCVTLTHQLVVGNGRRRDMLYVHSCEQGCQIFLATAYQNG
jgi:hypothetical protein